MEYQQECNSILINKRRIPYIDVAKGILILLVIYDHLPDVFMYLLKMSNTHVESLNEWQWVYKLYFMPAFFCITGMCSNFHKDFYTFIWSNFKILIIPNIVWGVILNHDFGGVFLHGGGFWFLSALFVSKMSYYTIVKYLDNFLQRIVLLLFFVVIGFWLNGISAKYDIWFFHYALCLTIFIEFGRIISNSNMKYLLMWSVIYIILCFIMYWGNLHKPVVALGTNCRIYEAPLYLLSAFGGSCLVISFSKLINSNRLLEFFGRESLIFYIFQVKVLLYIEMLYLTFTTVAHMNSVLVFFSIVFILTVLTLSVISIVIDNKHLSFLIGKF